MEISLNVDTVEARFFERKLQLIFLEWKRKFGREIEDKNEVFD